MKSKSGFTLVELLIVIVVIAILAAISIVAYSGIQVRAQYASLASALGTYEKAFRAYKAVHGQYPNFYTGLTSECLGNLSDYPATSTHEAGQCGSNKWSDKFNDDINQQLSEFIGTPPRINVPVVTYSSGDSFRGVYLESGRDHYYFEYPMPNSTECPYGKNAWAGYGDEVLCTVYVID